MSQELDVNKVAASVIQTILSDSVKGLAGSLREVTKRIISSFKKDLNTYLNTTLQRCCYIKTPIINRDKPTYLFSIYVNTILQNGNKITKDNDLIAALPKLKSIVIAGNAGSGKSMMMRYLFVSLCERGFGKIPLFIELRNLNSFHTKDLQAFIYYSIVGPGAVITEKQFETSLQAGAYTIILDGFDEIDFDMRKEIELQILRFREAYGELFIVVSSRPNPENRFHSWGSFTIFEPDDSSASNAANSQDRL